MSTGIFNAAGTYTDQNDSTQVVTGPNVSLTTSGEDTVFIDSYNDDEYVNSGLAYVFNGPGSGNFVELSGFDDQFYGGVGAATIYAEAQSDSVIGSANSGSKVYLESSDDSYYGGLGSATIYIGGTSASVASTTTNDTINLLLQFASNATIDGGSGSTTLNLQDFTGDGNAINVDVGQDVATGLNGSSFKSITNLDYSILNPGNGATRSANTSFRTEGGTNTFDFTYSSANNTVLNTGGTDTVTGGPGTQAVVGGTGTTVLGVSSGTDYLYGGTGTNDLVALGSTGGTARLYGGSGTDELLGYLSVPQPPINGIPQPPIVESGAGNEYFYGGSGKETFIGGGGSDVFVEGTGTNVFEGSTGTDAVFGSSGGSQVVGGSGSDFVYTGTQAQYFYSGSGKEYFEEMQGTQSNGKLDVVDNFQTQSAGGKGTFVFLPSYEASSTSFVQGQGGVYVQTEIGGGQSSSILVANTNNIAAVKAQTFFNL